MPGEIWLSVKDVEGFRMALPSERKRAAQLSHVAVQKAIKPLWPPSGFPGEILVELVCMSAKELAPPLSLTLYPAFKYFKFSQWGRGGEHEYKRASVHTVILQ